MKSFVFFLLFVLSSCLFSHGYAACCHAILMGDTFSPTGSTAFSELQESSYALEALCIACGMDYKEILLLGENGIEALNRAIDSMHNTTQYSSSEDLVFFLFLGHGYREAAECSPWPTFFFFHTGESLPMQTLIDRLSRVPARFLCIFADCCNNPVIGKMLLPSFELNFSPPHVLLNTGKGKFILAAAEAGSAAYCTSKRHCCTAALWQALCEESCQSIPNWEAIGPRVAQLLRPLQTPYYVLDKQSF